MHKLTQHAAAGEDRWAGYPVVIIVFFKTDTQILLFQIREMVGGPRARLLVRTMAANGL
jgi:hypothetical protein